MVGQPNHSEADWLICVLFVCAYLVTSKSMVTMADIVCPVVRADVTCYWKDMWRRLDAMRRLWQLCDVRLRTDDGSSFMAHSPVLAASSDVLHHMLVATRHETFVDGPGIVPVHSLTPDVLRITLDFIYGVTPTSRADFERLRIGAARLGIEGAYEYCCRRLGESASGLLHPRDSAVQTSDATSVVEASATVADSHCGMVVPMDEPSSQGAEETMSSGDRNSSENRPTSLDAGESSELPQLGGNVTNGVMDLPSDVHHAEMMAHMSLEDLARSDECPHLRQLAGEILPAPILSAHCLEDDSSTGSLDDDGCSFLDSVPLKKRIRNSQPSDSNGSNTHEETNDVYMSKTARSSDRLMGDVGSHSVQSSAHDLSTNSDTALLMSQHSCPSIFLTDSSISGGNQCSSAVTTSGSIAAGIDFSNPLDAVVDFPAVSFSSVSIIKSELADPSLQDCSVSYITDCYPSMSSSNNEWSTDQPLGLPVMTSNFLPSLSTCTQPFASDNFASILSTTDVTTLDITTANSVSSSTSTIVTGTADVLSEYSQDASFANFGVLPSNSWQSGGMVSLPHAGENTASDLVQSDNGVAYFSHSPVVSSIPHFVPTIPTMNPSTISSSSTVTAAGTGGSIISDLSFISLDDVSAVLKANGFSDKTSSPIGDVTTVNHTAQNHMAETTAEESHSCDDVNRASTQTTVNESTGTSSAARVCIFCQKPCKSER